jgi:hypothetical protein
MRILNFIAGVLLLLTVSCEKTSVSDCFKSTGSIVREERPITGFHTVVLHDNVNLVLESSGTNHLTIEAGKNLLKKIVTEVTDSVLTIRNNNSCNWVRNYDKPITAYLSVNKLDTLVYRSIGNVTSNDTIKVENMEISVKEGAGEIGFIVDATILHCNLHYGTADIKMKGYAEVCYVYSNGFGLIDNRNLHADFVYLDTRSSNDVYVQVHKVLGVTIDNIGNVYYTGSPYDVSFVQNSTGQLIKLDK